MIYTDASIDEIEKLIQEDFENGYGRFLKYIFWSDNRVKAKELIEIDLSVDRQFIWFEPNNKIIWNKNNKISRKPIYSENYLYEGSFKVKGDLYYSINGGRTEKSISNLILNVKFKFRKRGQTIIGWNDILQHSYYFEKPAEFSL